MADICGDNRFEQIARIKERLIKATNIESSPKEMEVIDDILFRFWQMGWLDLIELDKAINWLRLEMETRFNDAVGQYESCIFTGSLNGENWLNEFREAMLN